MRRKIEVHLARLIIVAGILCIWQWGVKISFLRDRGRIFDPIFISSPDEVGRSVYQLWTGTDGRPKVWSYLGTTLEATLIGTVIGLALGIMAGLLASSFASAAETMWPLIVALNSVPRIALIPLIVLVVGPTVRGAEVAAVLIVFFIGFFNALEGGRSVPKHLLDNAELMGAGALKRPWHLRFPYVLAWAFATVPNAISLGLIAVVTTELLTEVHGMGSLIQQATSNLDSGLTFGVIVYLATIGLLLTYGAEILRRRVIRWPL